LGNQLGKYNFKRCYSQLDTLRFS